MQSELGRPNIAPYTASKGAVKMLTKGMATDWGKHGMRVNGSAPGYFRTELNQALVADEKFSALARRRTPLGRWGEVRGAGRRGDLPRVRCVELRQRARALRRRRRDGVPLTLMAEFRFGSVHQTTNPRTLAWKLRECRPSKWSERPL